MPVRGNVETDERENISENMYFFHRRSSLQVTTQDEGIINFQPGFDNAAQSAIVTGALCDFKAYSLL